MGKLVKADEAGLEPFIEELNGCASDGYGGAHIAIDVLPRSIKILKNASMRRYERGKLRDAWISSNKRS